MLAPMEVRDQPWTILLLRMDPSWFLGQVWLGIRLDQQAGNFRDPPVLANSELGYKHMSPYLFMNIHTSHSN